MIDPGALSVFMLLLGRTGGLLWAVPGWEQRQLPVRVRVAATFVLALAMTPFVSQRYTEQAVPGLEWLPLELAWGLALGLSMRILLASAEIAGELMGVSLGLGFANFFDPGAGEAANPVRRIAQTLALLAFIAVGGLAAPVRVLAHPLLADLVWFELLRDATRVFTLFSDSFSLGVALAMPMIVATTCANLAVGLANRAASGLNVFSVMLALTALIGWAVLWAGAPFFIDALRHVAERALALVPGGMP